MKKIIVLWLIITVHNWGATLGYFCGKFPNLKHREHYGIAGMTALSGPIAFPVVVFCGNFYQYGFVWR